MSAVLLNWRTLTPSKSPRFTLRGAELSFALCGPQSRFAVYEVRCTDDRGELDREYVVRDADLVSDAELRAGKRPPVIARTRDYDRLIAWIEAGCAVPDAA